MTRSTSGGGRRARRQVRVAFTPLRDLRRALTVEGDVASDIAFQNDVNSLLATIARLSPLGPQAPDLPRAVVAGEPPLGSQVRRSRSRR